MPGFTLTLLFYLLFLSTAYPLWKAWRAVAATSLRHTMLWVFAAGLTWLAADSMTLLTDSVRPMRYLAVCMTACVVVAVLGARKPGMAAWNFVVVGLLAVLLLPVLQQPWEVDDWRLEETWFFFVATIIGVGAVNHAGTRLGLPVLVVAVSVNADLLPLTISPGGPDRLQSQINLALGCHAAAAAYLWLAYWLVRQQPSAPFKALWWTFRDRYGFIWGLRVKEQFNNAAAHAGWNARLTWKGLSIDADKPRPTDEEKAAMLETLRAALKRFGLQ